MRLGSRAFLFAAALGLAACSSTGPTGGPYVEVRFVSAGGFCSPPLCYERLEIWSDARATVVQGSMPAFEKQLDNDQLRVLRALVHGREFQRLQRSYRGMCVDAPADTLEIDQGNVTQVVERIDCGVGPAVLQQTFEELYKVRSLVLAPAPI